MPIIDPTTGKMTGYKTAVGGADTVFPFSSSMELIGSKGFSNQPAGTVQTVTLSKTVSECFIVYTNAYGYSGESSIVTPKSGLTKIGSSGGDSYSYIFKYSGAPISKVEVGAGACNITIIG